ncbi:heavy metal-associated isoprenylated plant protein 7-like [Nymphaea colorata]|nr:heavy metal-associated isoprenylated plant protein 7-like [Nymphaea colorata]
MLGVSFRKGRTTRKKLFHFSLTSHSRAPAQMGENQAEEKKEEKKEEGKVAEGAGEKKEGGAEVEKKEETKNEGGGEGEKKEGEGEKKEDEKEEEEQNPEIVLKVDMHCEGCARKVQRSLRGFPGVEEVQTDSKAHKVVVKGKKADPVKVCQRIQKKSGKKAELISPLPKPPEAEKEEEKEQPKQEEKKEEPVVVTVVLTVRMHCESCAQVVQRRIHKMKGVESVETDLKNDKVIVKGVVDPKKLVEYVYKQTRKQATIVPPPPPEEEKKEEVKEEEKKEEKGESEKKEGEEGKDGGEEEKKSEMKKSEYWPPARYYMEYAYPPQIFSDENPNACSIV